jgi:hypothetical protein
MITAWGDESQSNGTLDPGTYILAAALTFDDDIETIREGMTRLLLPGNRKVHWRDDSAARHRRVADTIAKLPVEGFVVVRHAPQDSPERSRRKCLSVLLPELRTLGCETLTMESRGTADDGRDRDMVRHLQRQKCPGGGVRLFHEVGPKQPLLWIADALCGAVMDQRCGEPVNFNRLDGRITIRVIEAGA